MNGGRRERRGTIRLNVRTRKRQEKSGYFCREKQFKRFQGERLQKKVK